MWALLAGGRIASSQEASFKPQPQRSVPGELIVKYKNAGFGRVAPESTQQRVNEKYRMETLSNIPSFGIQRVKVPEQRIKAALDALTADPAIEFATRNYIVYPDQVTPNDPEWTKLWGLQKIDMPKAWQRTTGDARVIVAVLDTGVDADHPDLKGNLWQTSSGEYGMSFCTDFSDPRSPRVLPPQPGAADRFGHGTHVAGTIAAEGNNGLYVVGVAWRVKVMALKFLCNTDGSGTTGDAIRAMEYAVNNGAHILNNSWGGAPPDLALETAIRETNARGLLFVASAGNSGRDQGAMPNYPAAFRIPNVVAVAATDPQDTLATFSNWSATLVPLAAPGVGIVSTLPGKTVGSYSGTSMAAPHVSGCAALIKALDTKRLAPELRMLLLDKADQLGGLQGKIENGRRLNCANSLR